MGACLLVEPDPFFGRYKNNIEMLGFLQFKYRCPDYNVEHLWSRKEIIYLVKYPLVFDIFNWNSFSEHKFINFFSDQNCSKNIHFIVLHIPTYTANQSLIIYWRYYKKEIKTKFAYVYFLCKYGKKAVFAMVNGLLYGNRISITYIHLLYTYR